MTKLILSTGNVMSAGPSIIRRGNTRSNLELVNSLRDSFAAARQDYALNTPSTNGFTTPPTPSQAPVEAWTEQDSNTLYIPRINWQAAGLRDEPSEYEITVKLFLLPNTPVQEREQYVRDALALVSKELGIQTVDLLIVSFPGMSFEGNCEKEVERHNAQQGNLDEEVATWRIFEDLHKKGLAKQLGIAEFGSEKLRAFLERTSIHPTVDQINLRDCCNVPQPLKKLAEEKGIELNVHTDCTDILPHGTLRDLLGYGPQGAGVLADAANNGVGLEGDVGPHWVARYTAFVRNRGVIENKGYFAGAELK
ncbi:Putative glutamate--cysteine ligase regulatory subunit-like protein [Cladobotryum mycophilum]|uniref:GCS light chain n=1 Tax=Cladobotryum mycophilum TaxID=491253 RepID=A0ABR0S6R0_9HYPO